MEARFLVDLMAASVSAEPSRSARPIISFLSDSQALESSMRSSARSRLTVDESKRAKNDSRSISTGFWFGIGMGLGSGEQQGRLGLGLGEVAATAEQSRSRVASITSGVGRGMRMRMRLRLRFGVLNKRIK